MTAPLPIREAIVVEGRYDKAALAGTAYRHQGRENPRAAPSSLSA